MPEMPQRTRFGGLPVPALVLPVLPVPALAPLELDGLGVGVGVGSALRSGSA